VLLRSSLNTLLNNIRHVLAFEQVKQYTDEIESYLSSLPGTGVSESEEAHSLIRLKLLQYQLALHNRFLRSAAVNSERKFSAMVILESASKVIEIHQRLVLENKRALQFLGYDLLRAALSIANVVSVQTLTPVLAPIIFQHTPLIHEAIGMLTDSAARLGCEQRQMWVALAALGFVKSNQNPSQREQYMKEAVNLITKAYNKIMACQEVPHCSLPAVAIRELRERRSSRGIVDYLPSVPGQPIEPDMETSLIDASLFCFDDLDAWTFEDWMFTPNDLSLTFGGS
jgi:hypothetical protein